MNYIVGMYLVRIKSYIEEGLFTFQVIQVSQRLYPSKVICLRTCSCQFFVLDVFFSILEHLSGNLLRVFIGLYRRIGYALFYKFFDVASTVNISVAFEHFHRLLHIDL
jgi:hypothetical protein